ncbi:TetR/AcrR family transcriptional regulator C-terminal domain-containing protein [Kibdelosporangium lantanae]|uniref:TetR/AcrR family transcriptional regulator C-terminal domain-containing protein n=1 Tax=Kibdelosporangium lantanae TaxID=1497396 RepID=A0ABW3MCX4_9PSEU
MILGVATPMMPMEEVLDRLSSLRQHQRRGQRSPHKPLLVLFALGRLVAEGSSAVSWSMDSERLAGLIRDYGRPSLTSSAQSAAYPFTRLRADGIWTLDQDVPDDLVRPLVAHQVIGRLTPQLEDALRDPDVASEQFLALLTAPIEARSAMGTKKVTTASTREVAHAAVTTFLSAYLG